MSFSANTALNVHSPAPMIRKKGRNGFEYEVEGDEVVIYDVPLFDEHEDSERPEPFSKIDADKLQEIAAHTRWQEKAGKYPRLIVSHTEPGKPDETVRIFGRAENVHVKRNPDLKRQTIYADWRVDKEFFDYELAQGRFPGRSIELEMPNKDEPENGFFISNIAALRATPPARPLKDMGRFQRYQRDPQRRAVAVSRFQEISAMPEITEERLSELIAQAYTKGAKDAEKFAGKYEHGPDCDCSECKEKYAMDEDEDKKDSDKESKPRRGRPRKDAGTDAAKYAAIEAQVAAYKRDNEEMRAAMDVVRGERRTERVKFQMEDWKRRGYRFGSSEDEAAEFQRFCAITDDEAWSREVARVERFYTRVPVDARVDMRHVTTGTSHDPADIGPKIEAAAQAYKKAHPDMPYWRAVEEISGQVKSGAMKL